MPIRIGKNHNFQFKTLFKNSGNVQIVKMQPSVGGGLYFGSVPTQGKK
jgi:hypothetical protein